MTDTRPKVAVDTAEQWRAWLQVNHDTSPGIWLVTWKKGHGPHLGYDDIVDLSSATAGSTASPARSIPAAARACSPHAGPAAAGPGSTSSGWPG
jgi:hypothetical protein